MMNPVIHQDYSLEKTYHIEAHGKIDKEFLIKRGKYLRIDNFISKYNFDLDHDLLNFEVNLLRSRRFLSAATAQIHIVDMNLRIPTIVHALIFGADRHNTGILNLVFPHMPVRPRWLSKIICLEEGEGPNSRVLKLESFRKEFPPGTYFVGIKL